MGRITRSWELVKQSFSVLRDDRELLLLPIASGISCLLVSAFLLLGGGLMALPYVKSSLAADSHWRPGAPLIFPGIFLFYAANYFVIVFFNVALVNVAASRLLGGHATIRDSMRLAWERKGKILEWALLAATVGTILRLIEQRLDWLGRLVVKLIGVAWTLASYFVAPVLAFENLGPIDALKHSARLFRDNWGENVVGGFSFGLTFFLLSLPGFALFALAAASGRTGGLLLGAVVLVLYLLLLSVVSATVQGIFVAALYRYATTRQVAPGFKLENFSMAWQPK
ncbi:MAG: DUF4013 domain-containing protein [Acidobacteria bacterium]|nr:DUF4013 domain-containing protein [Acidobacteriota bacterium]